MILTENPKSADLCDYAFVLRQKAGNITFLITENICLIYILSQCLFIYNLYIIQKIKASFFKNNAN